MQELTIIKTSLSDVSLLTTFKPHSSLFLFCASSGQTNEKAYVSPPLVLQEVQTTHLNTHTALPPNHQKTPKPVSLPNLSSWFMTCLWATVLFLEILVIWAVSLPLPSQCICSISTENIQAKFEGGKMYPLSVESSKQLEKREMWASRQWPARLRSLFFFSDLLTAGEHVLWSLLLPADNSHFRLFCVAFAELNWASVIDWTNPSQKSG